MEGKLTICVARSGDGTAAAPKAPKAKKSANPKAKKEGTAAKKRKVEEIEEGEGDEMKVESDGIDEA
jgi:hypothetical protein